MILRQDRIIGLYGMKGSGKTTLGNYIMKQYLNNSIRVVLYNTDLEKYSKHELLSVINPIEDNAINLEYLNKKLKEIRASSSNSMIYIRDLDAFYDKATSLSKSSAEIKDISTRGRHTRNGLIYESKQPRYIPAKLISNTDLFFIGNFTEKEDLLRFKSLSGNILYHLPMHSFLMIDRWDMSKKIIVYDTKSDSIKIIQKLENIGD